jgi:hypothetical protein
MKISLPQGLSRCDDRSIKAKTNQTSGGPEDWFTPEKLQHFGFKSFNFDFFVNWNTERFVRTLWFKRFIDINVNEFIQTPNWQQLIKNSLINFEGENQIKDLRIFCHKYNLKADFLIFNEESWSDESLVIYARLQENDVAIKVIRLDELKQKISIGTGRPFNIGSKGLFYSTSRLECYLSKTDTPYPGDADLLLTNADFNQFILIEFKKHNMSGEISEQKLSNYYPRPDGAKYRRLDLLRQYFPNTKLYTIYYTTDSRCMTKIELNSFNNKPLHEGETIIMPSPTDKLDQNDIMNYLSNCEEFFRETGF